MTLPPADKTDKTDETPAAVNEWGIPDWRDLAAYGDVKRWASSRWRWEYHRRRADLRTYFDQNAERCWHYWQPFVGKPGFDGAHLKPDQRGFYVTVEHMARERLGYGLLPNPRIGDQPDMLLWTGYLGGDAQVQTIEGDRCNIGQYLDLHGICLTDEQKAFLGADWLAAVPVLNLGRDRIAVVFDLNRPLEAQIELASGVLKASNELRGRPSQKRRHAEKWLKWLRVIDAHDAGATWREIADLFYKQGVLSRYKSPEGGYTSPPPQAARALWLAAKGLQSNF